MFWAPIQLFIQGQWWSILTIHLPQILQWCARGGLRLFHRTHTLLNHALSFFLSLSDNSLGLVWDKSGFSISLFGCLYFLINTGYSRNDVENVPLVRSYIKISKNANLDSSSFVSSFEPGSLASSSSFLAMLKSRFVFSVNLSWSSSL